MALFHGRRGGYKCHPEHVLTPSRGLHLAVALDGAGWHPAAWREPQARPGELFTARYWTDLVAEAERGLLDFVTIEDGLSLQSSRYGEPDARTDQVRGRLDAVLIAARVAPVSRHIGLVPTVVVTHTEPFHASKAIATLDYVSGGRAGVRIKVSSSPDEARHFGRRQFPPLDLRRRDDAGARGVRQLIAELFGEAADYVEVTRRLWDSWEDDAEIRDASTGRFVDRDKLHYIDFAGTHFSVKGPSITPRPPQGQPIVSALGHATPAYQLIAQVADIGYVTPRDADDAAAIVAEIRAAQATSGPAISGPAISGPAISGPAISGRADDTIGVFADLVVFLAASEQAAVSRRDRLDELAGEPYVSDAAVFTGTAGQLADLMQQWQQAGVTGFRLRPGALPGDLESISRALVPELQGRGLFRSVYQPGSLRDRLGLPRPANRYAAAGSSRS